MGKIIENKFCETFFPVYSALRGNKFECQKKHMLVETKNKVYFSEHIFNSLGITMSI